jgi:hypothetical protein
MFKSSIISLFAGGVILALMATWVWPAEATLEPIGDYGAIDWVAHKVIATGIGAPPSRSPNAMRAKTLAQRAAVVVAQRNLLEVVKGVHLDSTTVVENFLTVEDAIIAKVRGLLNGAQIENQRLLKDGSVEVTLGMPLRGELFAYLLQMAPISTGQPALLAANPNRGAEHQDPVQPEALSVNSDGAVDGAPAMTAGFSPKTIPVTEPLSETASTYTGLLIDARGTGFQPCLKPNVYSRGTLVYPGAGIAYSEAVDDGFVRFSRDIHQARQNPRITPRPYTVKAIKAVEGLRSLVLPSEAIEVLQSILKTPDNCLAARRVVIVY